MDRKLNEFWSKRMPFDAKKFSWDKLPSIIHDSNDDFIILPLRNVPIKRDNNFEIAALSPREEYFFYLMSDKPLQNISKYSPGTLIGIDRSETEMILKEFNPGITCIKNDDSLPIQIRLLNHEELENSQYQYKERLSEIEFVPPTSIGIMAAICRTEDFETRRYLYSFHDEISKDIANIERGINKYARENNRLEPIEVYASYKDGNFSAVLFFKNKDELHFEQYHQTSTLDFAANFYHKIYI